MLIDITEAETGQRGYILTGEDDYLKPYNDGSSAITGAKTSHGSKIMARIRQLHIY